ncbi:SdpI family protein [Corynebacterium sp.]|uniref:SdpI family protein n=1 Tax=Corynebacterium sp. TaxID=1720 RepID=UPI0026DF6B88|nr:SdpI family protein [Corynebacterium sp.]MDO5511809.1 hypothetical protein [Corynebacterium sp.]
MSEMIGPLIGVLTVALLFGPVVRAAARGEFDRGGLVGIRTRHTQRSDAAWRAGHAAALPWARRCLVVAAAVVLLAVVAQWTLGDPAGLVVALCGLVGQVGLVVLATCAANTAARET